MLPHTCAPYVSPCILYLTLHPCVAHAVQYPPCMAHTNDTHTCRAVPSMHGTHRRHTYMPCSTLHAVLMTHAVQYPPFVCHARIFTCLAQSTQCMLVCDTSSTQACKMHGRSLGPMLLLYICTCRKMQTSRMPGMCLTRQHPRLSPDPSPDPDRIGRGTLDIPTSLT